MENEGIERYLKDNGIKPTYIRVKVYEYLIKHTCAKNASRRICRQ